MFKEALCPARGNPLERIGWLELKPTEPLEKIFERFLGESPIFKNRDVLRHDYIPSNLPHRDEHIQRLGGILAPSLGGSKVSNAFLYGKTGTGKTIVAKFVLNKLGSKASEVGSPLQLAYVNCRLAGTNYRVLAEISRSIGLEVPFTGLALGELFDRFRRSLDSKSAPLLVVLDEVDALVKADEDHSLLYELTRVNESLRQSWIALVGISNDLRFKEYLDPRVLSSLSEEEVVFKPYLADELYDILSERAAMAFREGTITDGALRLAAALAAGEHGDARRALDLLRVAGELAEREEAKQVTEGHVRQALDKIEHDRVSEVLRTLPIHSKVLLVAAYLVNSYISEGAITGDVYNVYSELCQVINIEPLTQRRVSSLINELDIMGILNARVVSFGRYGRTKKIRLGISPKDIIEVYSEQDLGQLLNHVPKALHEKRRTP